MSRGFVKEGDQEEVPMLTPRAFLPPGVENFVTTTGLEALKERCAVELWSDSQYVVNALNNGWLRDWKRRGWKRRDGELKNPELWQELDALLERHAVSAHWVKGHAEDEYNNRCDALAVAERDKYALAP